MQCPCLARYAPSCLNLSRHLAACVLPPEKATGAGGAAGAEEEDAGGREEEADEDGGSEDAVAEEGAEAGAFSPTSLSLLDLYAVIFCPALHPPSYLLSSCFCFEVHRPSAPWP